MWVSSVGCYTTGMINVRTLFPPLSCTCGHKHIVNAIIVLLKSMCCSSCRATAVGAAVSVQKMQRVIEIVSACKQYGITDLGVPEHVQ